MQQGGISPTKINIRGIGANRMLQPLAMKLKVSVFPK
jgi:hypothetical protein